jgi:hypothetical protein
MVQNETHGRAFAPAGRPALVPRATRFELAINLKIATP